MFVKCKTVRKKTCRYEPMYCKIMQLQLFLAFQMNRSGYEVSCTFDISQKKNIIDVLQTTRQTDGKVDGTRVESDKISTRTHTYLQGHIPLQTMKQSPYGYMHISYGVSNFHGMEYMG